MKRLVFSVITILGVFIATCFAGEIGLRIKGLFDENRGLKNSMGGVDRKYFHRFKPNSRFRLVASKNNEYDVAVRINNFSFRGKDITKEKKEGVTRIIAMGDSFTFGVGASENETIPFLIEKELNEQGKNVEVINAGFGSDSPLLQYLRTKDEYLDFEPDLVLYFFDFSDLVDDWRYEKNLVYDRSGNILRCDPVFTDGKRDWWKTLMMRSKLCVYIDNKVVRLFDKIRILGLKNYIMAKIEGKRAKALIVQKQNEEKNAEPIKYDGYFMIRGRDNLPQITAHFRRAEKYLNLIRDTLAEKEIPMILAIYPYGIHVGPDQWGEGREYWGFERGRVYDDYYAFDLLEDYAARNKIPCINLLSAFLENKDKKLFFDIDGHFTPDGDRIAASRIARDKALLKY